MVNPPINNETAGPTDGLRGQLILQSDGRLIPPKHIIQTVNAARAVYWQYRSDALKRIALYASIEGLIAGNPPYNPVELQKQGLSHISNFNNLDGRSLYERSGLAYWNLINEAETLVTFELRGINDPKVVEYERIMAKNWTEIVKKWPSFITQFNTLSAQLIKFGISPVIWTDERSWKWRTVELSRFFISDQASTDIEQLTTVAVVTTFTVQYLYSVYTEFKDKKEESPWDVDVLATWLIQRANTFVKDNNLPGTILDVMDIQRMYQNGDLKYCGYFSDSVKLVSLLQKEYDGKISHYMFDETFESDKFLFFAPDQYNNFSEAIVIFTASPGEFTIHSNRGVGHKIFAGCQALMQLDCDIVNGARLASTPLIKSPPGTPQDAAPIRFYPGVPTNIGMSEFVQNDFGSNINQLIGVSQYLNQKLQYNTANSGDDPGVPDRNIGSLSAPQFVAKSFKEFSVLKQCIAHFYSQADGIIRNMVAKMWHSKEGYPDYKEAKDWKDRCIQEGVPEEIFKLKNNAENSWALPRHLEAKATRVAGDGSTLSILMGLQELAPDVNAFSAEGQRQYLKQKVSAVFGPSYVKSYLPPQEPDEISGGASLAGVENIAMRQGESPIFSPDNDQRAHISIHLALGDNIVQSRQQQQMDPVAADKVFSVLIPHLAEHIQAVATNPYTQSFYQGILKGWEQLSEYARLNRKNATAQLQAEIKKKQEMEAEQNRVMSEEELKNLQVKNEEARKDYKVQQTVLRAKEASDTRAEIMKEKVVRDSDNQRLKISLDSRNSNIENASLQENREALERINGQTIAPADIETPV